MKIMVCHDGSQRSQAALERTTELFRSQEPRIILVTVVEEPLDATSQDEASFESWRASRGESLKQAADWVVEHGLNVDAILAVGDPRKMLIEATEARNPDILVVAGRGSGLFQGVVSGSVSAFLLRHAECPVLIMH
ncbi:MAG: universal stress protein [Deltaproteobacteria bacterium]|nr:universal stress protein [Deltaproteobacteria bacterium]